MPTTTTQQAPPGTEMNGVLFLLSLSVLINYIDRSNLSIAAPLIKDELGLSAWQLGKLLSAFFWTYALMQIPAGWLVDRLDVKWVFAAGLFIWSAATAVTGALHGFAALLIVRVILGLGESVAFPSYSKILCSHFRESRRGFANAMIMTGLALGPALGILVGGIAVARFGWRSFFVVLGLAGLLWLAPWLLWMPPRAEVVRASLFRWCGIPFHLAAEISMGHVHRTILHQLFLVLSRYLAAVLPRTGTSSQHERNGEGGRPGLPNVGDLIGGDGKTGRSMDSSRSISNRGPQGMDGLWPRRHWRYVHFHYHDGGRTLHWNASPHGSLPRNQHLQQLGVPANPGRTSHGGSMGRSAELCGKSCGSRGPSTHWISSRSHGFLLLAVLYYGNRGLDRSSRLVFRGRTSRRG